MPSTSPSKRSRSAPPRRLRWSQNASSETPSSVPISAPKPKRRGSSSITVSPMSSVSPGPSASASVSATARKAPVRRRRVWIELELAGVEHVVGGKAGDLADARLAHALGALDVEPPEAHHGARPDGDRHVERLAREVGHDLLVGDLGLGAADLAPALDGLGRGLPDDARGRGLAEGEVLGQLGAGRQGVHLRAAEAVERPRVHADLDAPDPLGRVEGRDLGRLAPVHQDRDHGAVVALRVEPAHDARVVGARRRDQVLGLGQPLVLGAQQQRGLLDLGAQILLALHGEAHGHALRPARREPDPEAERHRRPGPQGPPRGKRAPEAGRGGRGRKDGTRGQGVPDGAEGPPCPSGARAPRPAVASRPTHSTPAPHPAALRPRRRPVPASRRARQHDAAMRHVPAISDDRRRAATPACRRSLPSRSPTPGGQERRGRADGTPPGPIDAPERGRSQASSGRVGGDRPEDGGRRRRRAGKSSLGRRVTPTRAGLADAGVPARRGRRARSMAGRLGARAAARDARRAGRKPFPARAPRATLPRARPAHDAPRARLTHDELARA